jgi:hypothetical protein
MNLEISHERWEFNNNGRTVIIRAVPYTFDRGGCLGETTYYGSVIEFKSEFDKFTNVLKITDKKCPDFVGSIIDIVTQHIKQIKLGTFGVVHAPRHSDHEFITFILHRLNIEPETSISGYHSIPIYKVADNPEHQYWEIFDAGWAYKAKRKYARGHYTTTIKRVKETYTYPRNEGTPNPNIVKRAESVSIASLTAEPLTFNDILSYFK